MRGVITILIALLGVCVAGQEMQDGRNYKAGFTMSGGKFIANSGFLVEPSKSWEFYTLDTVLGMGLIFTGGSLYIDWNGDGSIYHTSAPITVDVYHNWGIRKRHTVRFYSDDWSLITVLRVEDNGLVDDLTNVDFASMDGLLGLYLYNNSFSGTFPHKNSTCYNYRVNDNLFTDYDTAYYSNNTTYVLFHNNYISSSSKINEIIEDANAGITVPTQNMTIRADGPNMGTLPDGESNTHLVALKAKFTSASKTLTYNFNMP